MPLVEFARGGDSHAERGRSARPGRRSARGAHRLPRLLLHGAGHDDLPRGHPLLPGAGERRRRGGRGDAAQGPHGRTPGLRGADRAQGPAAVPRHPLLRQTDPHRPPQLRPHRPGKHRRVHRPRRLRCAGQGAQRDVARGRAARDERLRAARPRRRRLPHRPEVGVRPALAEFPQVRHLQRRRRGSRRVHGSLHPGRRPAQRHGRDDHRRLCDRRLGRLHLLPRRVSAGDRPPEDGHRPGARVRSAGRGHPGQRLQLRVESQRRGRRLCLR